MKKQLKTSTAYQRTPYPITIFIIRRMESICTYLKLIPLFKEETQGNILGIFYSCFGKHFAMDCDTIFI